MMLRNDSSSDYESVRLSDNETMDMEDRQIFRQIKVNGKSEIKEYHSFKERFYALLCMDFSCFGDDEFDYDSIELDESESTIEDQHLKLLEMKPIQPKTPSRTTKKKRHSNNNKKPENDVEDPVLIISAPPPDSTREQSSESDDNKQDDGSDNNDIISLPVPTSKPKTPPNSSASSSSEDISQQPPTILHYLSAASSSESDDESQEEQNEHMICITSIKTSIVPKAIAFINTQKQEITKLKQEYTKLQNRAILRKNEDEGKSYEKKITLILDLITWCSKTIEDLSAFSKRINGCKIKEKVFITYDINQYCDDVRSFLSNKTYIKFLRQEDGFQELPIIRNLPLVREM